MSSKKAFTPQQISIMKQMRKEGYKLQYIAHKMGCSLAGVWRRTKECDKRHIKHWNIEDIQELVRLKEQGTSYDKISSILQRSKDSCINKYYIIRRNSSAAKA